MNSIIKIPFQTTAFILILSVAIFSSDTFAQNGLRIFDVPGGSGDSSTQSEESNDDTFLYVAGGLIIAGILVYALVIKKDDKPKDDTTASVNSNLILSNLTEFNSPEEEVQRVKDKIPFDLFMGVKNNEGVMNDKTYLFGLRVKL